MHLTPRRLLVRRPPRLLRRLLGLPHATERDRRWHAAGPRPRIARAACGTGARPIPTRPPRGSARTRPRVPARASRACCGGAVGDRPGRGRLGMERALSPRAAHRTFRHSRVLAPQVGAAQDYTRAYNVLRVPSQGRQGSALQVHVAIFIRDNHGRGGRKSAFR